MCNVVWITIFDGSFIYMGHRTHSLTWWIRNLSADDFLIKKGEIFILERYSYVSKNLCENPLYFESLLLIEIIICVPSDKNLDKFQKFKEIFKNNH